MSLSLIYHHIQRRFTLLSLFTVASQLALLLTDYLSSIFFFFWFLDRLYQVLGSNPHSPERELYQLMNSADTALFGNPSLFTVSEVSLFAAQFL